MSILFIKFFAIAILALGFGWYIFRYPMRMLDIQKRFYANLNWRIEPISLEKELRNTRLMGIFLIVFVVICSVVFVYKFGN